MKAPARRVPSPAGFNLIEVVGAIAIVGATVLPMLGILGIGLGDGREAWNRYNEARMRATVSQLLLDPAWPENSGGPVGWTAEGWLSLNGGLISDPDPTDEALRMAVRMELKGIPGLGWQSPWLQAVQVKFFAGDTKVLLGQCVQQRMRRPTG